MTAIEKILLVIRAAGAAGITVSGIATTTGMPMGTVSGSAAKLLATGKIKSIGVVESKTKAGLRRKSKNILAAVTPTSTPATTHTAARKQRSRTASQENIPSRPQDFWADIRKRVVAQASKAERAIDDAKYQQLLHAFEADLRELVENFTDCVSRARFVPDSPVPRRRLVKACHALNIPPPPAGKPADIKAAKLQRRKMIRVYHPDVTGSESTRAAFEAAIAAFDTIEQYNQQFQRSSETTTGDHDAPEKA